MNLADLIQSDLAQAEHFICESYEINDPRHSGYIGSIRCKCGYILVTVLYDRVTYFNRHGIAVLDAANPHFFDRLKKLLTELHRRRQGLK